MVSLIERFKSNRGTTDTLALDIIDFYEDRIDNLLADLGKGENERVRKSLKEEARLSSDNTTVTGSWKDQPIAIGDKREASLGKSDNPIVRESWENQPVAVDDELKARLGNPIVRKDQPVAIDDELKARLGKSDNPIVRALGEQINVIDN